MLCAHCQRQFTPDNSGLDSPARVWRGRPRQYCSDRCRVQAHRARQRAQGVPRPTTKSADPQRELLHDAREVARDLVAAAAAARSALAAAASSIYGLLRRTFEAGSREILLVAAQDEFVAPTQWFEPELI